MEIKPAEEIRQDLLMAALTELKTKAAQVVADVMGQLYCDYLPHVDTDTESNIGNRVDGVIRNLVAGKFEKKSDSMVSVSDSYGRDHYVHINSYDGLVKPLCDLMGPEIVSARVKQLEDEVKSLKQQLGGAYWS
ncbi:hypothetical protein QN399_01115 [Pseudomonas sp. 10C3]|uniref:hypothetical protein n=1 Tax=Pseudomonas sp. 10C3 TaxID=3118753 RepID=UPI002E80B02C|nr:hypothetical protein [Pseudomonas sp. 10C3]MEE3504876.1 hypothetical protein [Pseudomonas sp. 10C3]